MTQNAREKAARDTAHVPGKPAGLSAFEQAGRESQPTLVAEFLDFIRYNKKWWLLPILIVLGLVGLLAVLAGTGVAPFIYTVF
jgi:hypothetical protein